MCGIVGYIGKRQAAPIILKGLEKLEYRGYDSAGVAVLHEGKIEIQKCKGRLAELEKKTGDGQLVKGSLGIGHTRWATHGEPSDINSHPHLSADGRFAVVHNGIIENYQELRSCLSSQGYRFVSDTDTEVVVNLVAFYDRGDILDTIFQVMQRLEGSYAIGLISAADAEHVYCFRKEAPLVVGRGRKKGEAEDDKGSRSELEENFFASDIPALLPLTRNCFLLDEKEVAVLSREEIRFYDQDKKVIDKAPYRVQWNADAAEKGGFEHFMLKEIFEQPKALLETLRPRIKDGRIVLKDSGLTENYVQEINRVFFIGCGSAYHVGVLGKEAVERLARIPAMADIASEFRYRKPILKPEDLVILVSQSGETADTLAALRLAKAQGARTLAIVNALGSSIAREADESFYIWAGPEISVATTKAYSCQAASALLLAVYFARCRGEITKEAESDYCRDLLRLPEAFTEMLALKDPMQRLAASHFHLKDIYFVGRALDYALALEGCLKLKEISYIHSEATPAGELKHGPISLIEKGSLVVSPAAWGELADKILSNLREIETRGAELFILSTEEMEARFKELRGETFAIKTKLMPLLQGLPLIVPLQLFAYYVTVLKGLDVDKPRNLAKSVTVE